MTPEDIKAINAERLGSWTSRLTGEHATPIMLVGVGHDHKSGQVVVLTTEEMSAQEIIAFLKGVLIRMALGPGISTI